MEELIQKDLFCFQCFLKFDKEVWYDMHLSLVHGHENETESLAKETKSEPVEIESPIEFSNISTNLTEEQDFDANSLKQTILQKERNKCKICDVSFACKSNLKRHMVSVHEGKKPFKCNNC